MKYTSIPPALNLWRGLKARHIFFSLVCFITILANVLAVVMSSLFQSEKTLLSQSQLFKQDLLPVYDGPLNNTIDFNGEEPPSVITQKAILDSDISLPPWVSSEFFFLPKEPDASGAPDSVFEFVTRGFGVEAKCEEMDKSDSDSSLQLSILGDLAFNSSISFITDSGQNKTCQLQSYNPFARETKSDIGLAGYGPRAIQITTRPHSGTVPDDLAWDYGELCLARMVLVWIRANLTDKPQSPTPYSSRAVICNPILRTAEFRVNTTSTGLVQSYLPTGPFDTNFSKYTSARISSTVLIDSIWSHFRPPVPTSQSKAWSNSARTMNWLSHFIMLKTGSRDLLNASVPLPESIESIVPIIKSIIEEGAAIFLGVHPELLARAPHPIITEGRVYNQQDRVFMVEANFIIALTILVLNLVVATLYFFRAPKCSLPRMPTNIASIMAYVASGQAAQDSIARNEGRLIGDGKGERLSFGKFVGLDGKPHLGIERASLVLPVKVGKTKSLSRWGGFGLFGLRKRQSQGKP